MSDAPTLYDEDFVAWSKEQAEALRAAARGGANVPLDWENLAEEVETLGASERRALHSQVQRIIRHLLKLEHSQATGPRPGWAETVNDARSEIELIFEMSPSLEREMEHVVDVELPRGARGAIKDLQKYGERDRATERALTGTRYSVDQILGDWFPAEPASASRRGAEGQ